MHSSSFPEKFDPYSRNDPRVLHLTPDDEELLSGEPVPLKRTVEQLRADMAELRRLQQENGEEMGSLMHLTGLSREEIERLGGI
jgi:hypothetical protein